MWINKKKYEKLLESESDLYHSRREKERLESRIESLKREAEANTTDSAKWRARLAKRARKKLLAAAPEGGLTVISNAGQFFHGDGVKVEECGGICRVYDRKGRRIAKHYEAKGYYFGSTTKAQK